MDGRAFLDVARGLAIGPTEAHWRSAAGRSYYALFQEALATLRRWGFAIPPHQNPHAAVRLRFTYATDPNVKRIGLVLEDLVLLRNKADYELALPGPFTTAVRVLQAVDDSRAAITLLDQIEGDAHRRAAAIASIRP